MKIIGIEGMTYQELFDEVDRGGRFVIFQYALSFLVISLKRPTDIHFLRANEGSFGKAIGPTIICFLFGWWGFPFGIIFTIESLFVNLKGGRSVTQEVMASLMADVAPEPEAAPEKPWQRGRAN